MFANPTKVGISYQVVATLVAVAVFLFSIGAYATAQAANLVEVSDTLGSSEPLVTSAHTISFTIPASGTLTIGETVSITFEPGSFAIGALASGDITVTVDTVLDPHAGFSTTTNSLQFNSVAAAAGSVVEVAIPDGFITSPAEGSYYFEVVANDDSAKSEVAIVSTVLVTAEVDTNFTFLVHGTATSTPVNGTSTTGSTTATTIPFGLLVAGQTKTLAQDLTVETNARYGFAVTVETDGNIRSANGADIDMFDDGVEVTQPNTVWNAPTPNVNQENTWGHWGLTTEDGDLNSNGGYYSSEFIANEYIAASTTPRVVFHHDNPADGSTPNIGSTTVGYQVQITALQEAADDYQAILMYIATPIF